MAATTLLIGALLGFVIAGVYAFVGARLSQRQVSADAELALQLFATWWFSLGGFQAATSSGELLAWAGVRDPGVHAGALYVSLLLLTVGIYGLVVYLLYLYTGRMLGHVPITLAYMGFFLALLYLLTVSDPTGLAVNPWGVEVQFAAPVGGLWALGIVVAYLLPPLIASGAYLSLYWRVETRTQRYRVAVVGLSLILWLGSGLAVYVAGIDQAAGWPLASKLIGLAGGLALFFAYFPPRWVQARGVEPLTRRSPLAAQSDEPS